MSQNPRLNLSTINNYGEVYKQDNDIFSYQLYRNKNGQIRKKVETLGGTENSYTYRYDNRDRLTAVRKNRKLVERYTYDANGNRLTATSKDRNISNQLQSYNADDQIQLINTLTQTYDVDGYLQTKTLPSGETYQFSYGTMGELLSVVTPSKIITYKHNALNQRVSKEVNGSTLEKYLWEDLTTLLAMYNKDDILVQRFEYADGRMPVAMTMGDTKYYLHYDQVGSLRAVSDINGNIVKEIVYDTYGNIISDTNSSLKVAFGFAGGLYDVNTKLTRFGYRDYDAYTGKWTAKDPIGFDGGDLNLYGYVLNDPIRSFDSNGLRGGKIGINTKTRSNLGDAFAAALAGAAASIGNAIDNAFPDEATSCGSTCEEKYPGYKKCNALPYGYDYSSESSAWKNGFSNGIGGYKKHSRRPVTGGPCAGYDGYNIHINIRSQSSRGGSITSCQCCDDSSGEAILKSRWRVHY